MSTQLEFLKLFLKGQGLWRRVGKGLWGDACHTQEWGLGLMCLNIRQVFAC